jgi:hypothetical protein
MLPAGVPLLTLLVLACGIGAALPPVGACLRALVPELVPDPGAARTFFAIDATALELTWITGPALAVTVGSAYSTGIALAGAGAMLLVGTAAFAAEPASRGWRPDPVRSHGRDNPGRSPGLRTLILVMVALSSVYGAVQVGLAAATSALGSVGSAGPLLAVWGVGSLLGGWIATRLGGGMRTAGGVSLLLAAQPPGTRPLARSRRARWGWRRCSCWRACRSRQHSVPPPVDRLRRASDRPPRSRSRAARASETLPPARSPRDIPAVAAGETFRQTVKRLSGVGPGGRVVCTSGPFDQERLWRLPHAGSR